MSGFLRRIRKTWRFAFYPGHECLHRRVLKEGLYCRELLGELGIRNDRMYLVVADAVQTNSLLSALALGKEVMIVFLIIGITLSHSGQNTGFGSAMSHETGSTRSLRAIGHLPRDSDVASMSIGVVPLRLPNR